MFFKCLSKEEFNFNKTFLSLLKTNNTKVIILGRKNEFLRKLSDTRGTETNQFVLLKNEQNKLKPFNFNINQYLESKKRVKKIYNLAKATLTQNKIPYRIFYYEDLTGSDKQIFLKEVTSFIGQASENFIPYEDNIMDIKKQNIYNVKDQILNYKKVAEKLKNDKDFISAITNEIN
jgi:hypothetical protein